MNIDPRERDLAVGRSAVLSGQGRAGVSRPHPHPIGANNGVQAESARQVTGNGRIPERRRLKARHAVGIDVKMRVRLAIEFEGKWESLRPTANAVGQNNWLR